MVFSSEKSWGCKKRHGSFHGRYKAFYALQNNNSSFKILFLVEIRIFADFSLFDAMKLRANERQDVPSYAFGMTLSRLRLDNVFSSHVPHSFFPSPDSKELFYSPLF